MTCASKVELVPSANVGGMLKGVGNLTKDALTFKWAQVTLPQSWPLAHLRPSLLVSLLDIDLRACGALRLVAFTGAVTFSGARAGGHNTVGEISGCRLPKMSRVQYT